MGGRDEGSERESKTEEKSVCTHQDSNVHCTCHKLLEYSVGRYWDVWEIGEMCDTKNENKTLKIKEHKTKTSISNLFLFLSQKQKRR